jgi:hypothetical protein
MAAEPVGEDVERVPGILIGMDANLPRRFEIPFLIASAPTTASKSHDM